MYKRQDDILTLNCRSEITFQSGSTNTDGCTTVSVTPERAEHGDTLLCQTWDWKMALRECVLLLQVKKPGKPEIITLVEAGTLAKMGMNSAGVGILLNALASDCKAEGVPLLLALRGILEDVYKRQAPQCGAFWRGKKCRCLWREG